MTAEVREEREDSRGRVKGPVGAEAPGQPLSGLRVDDQCGGDRFGVSQAGASARDLTSATRFEIEGGSEALRLLGIEELLYDANGCIQFFRLRFGDTSQFRAKVCDFVGMIRLDNFTISFASEN